MTYVLLFWCVTLSKRHWLPCFTSDMPSSASLHLLLLLPRTSIFRFHLAYFFSSFRFLIKFPPFQWVLHWLLYLQDELYLVPFPIVIFSLVWFLHIHIYLLAYNQSLPRKNHHPESRDFFFFFYYFLIANSPMPESITKLFIEWIVWYFFLLLITTKIPKSYSSDLIPIHYTHLFRKLS